MSGLVQVKGAEKILYGLDDVAGQEEIIIVEGEMDKLAMLEAGITNVVSVPDGAPQRVRPGELPPPDQDTKYSYLWNCRGEYHLPQPPCVCLRQCTVTYHAVPLRVLSYPADESNNWGS